jgi:aldehyde:ferredoxin oxidoreductase
MDYINNYNGTMLIVDLEKGETATEDLELEMMEKCLGGAALNLDLYQKYADRDPVVLGTGLFTATFVPASCLGIATFKCPLNQGMSHVPLTWQTGVELKLTGFDFVVILGKSEKPVRLWLHDGLADIEDSSDVWGKDTWETVDTLRQTYGDDLVQIVSVGKAGENKLPIAQVSENYWGSKDKTSLGVVFGEKNLKAIALRGLGALEVAEGFYDQCAELMKEITNGALKGRRGLRETISSLPHEGQIIQLLDSITHRNNACYHCPYACNTFVKYKEPPETMVSTDVADPGCLITDLSGFMSFSFLGKDAVPALERCFRLGLEPTAAAKLAEAAGNKDLQSVKEKLEQLAQSGGSLKESDLPHFYQVSSWPLPTSLESSLIQAFGIFSSAVPPMPIIASYQDFDLKEPALDRAEWWIRRQSLSYILGICPIFSLTSPEMSEEKLVELVKSSADWDNFDVKKLQEVVGQLVSQSLKVSEKVGEIHPSLKVDGFGEAINDLLTRFS